jgi:hypothetical protein
MAMDSETPDSSSTHRIASRFGRCKKVVVGDVGEADPVAARALALKKQLAGGSFQTVNQTAQESIREQVRGAVGAVGAVGAGERVHWRSSSSRGSRYNDKQFSIVEINEFQLEL